MAQEKAFRSGLQNYLLATIDFDNRQLEDILGIFSLQNYRKKERIVDFDGKFEQVFYIHSGILRLFYVDQEGGEHNKEFYSENQIILPMTPLIQEQSSLFTIEAIENVVASVCRVEAFRSKLSRYGSWEAFILPILDKKMHTMTLRQYELLACAAKKRYQNFCIQFPHLIDSIPDYHIASYLGISNVTLSRIKKAITF